MSDLHALKTYQSWLNWGEKFGFNLYGCNDEHQATFICKDKTTFTIPKIARDAIDDVMENPRNV